MHVLRRVALGFAAHIVQLFGAHQRLIATALHRDRAKGREIDARFCHGEMERDVPSITTATRSLARSLKQFRSNRLQKPRWLSAAETGDLEFIQKRLREGQDIEVVGDWGRTALWTAVRFGQTGVVAQLLAAGAKPDVGDSGLDCMTPLHVAVWQGNLEATRQLLEARANPNLRNWSGRTALDLVSRCVVQNERLRQQLRHELRIHGGQPGARPPAPTARGSPTESPGSSPMSSPRSSEFDDDGDGRTSPPPSMA